MKMPDDNRKHYEKEKEVSEEIPVVTVAEPAIKESKCEAMRKRRGDTIVRGVLYGCGAAIVAAITIKNARDFKTFDNAIKAKYGKNVREGNYFKTSPKKYWAQNTIWEENYKSNFDKVCDFIRSLNMKDDEYYSIDRCVDKSGKIVTELVQSRNGGWYHGTII